MPFDFEVGEERADERRVELTQVETRRRRGDLVVREAEQEPERVAVGGNGVGAGGPLRDETVGEERLQERRDGGHVLVPFGVSRSEKHTSELTSLMRISYAVFGLKKTTITNYSKTKLIYLIKRQ